MTDDKDYHLYILRCDNEILYTGIAIDPQQRLKQHQLGHPYGAKFTRRFQQLEIVYQVKIGNKVMACQLEYRIKQWNKKTKLKIIKTQPSAVDLLLQAGLI